ncbi:DUF5060 domain-containing protein [Pelagicoccus sp. SDUM812002]|uniref:DUF5060 domain-containing protein n=1 Tax=Pelagicoccus sp. SDUM812002 TaxID=3041266 RepID=UPI00280F13C4|nr:DUF5060 domain-containing protein [Pelagicoccus sp. SDUM812002]MDQ8184310.1 DUF5060 domain-containing protein [Pelagicoccus sp. SDUM812002]
MLFSTPIVMLCCVWALAWSGLDLRHARAEANEVRVWEMQEILLEANGDYDNPYVDVTCWIDLEGPGFSKRIYGYWDGGAAFKVRFVATAPGEWSWESGSNQPEDAGLNGHSGSARAKGWNENEKRENPNRRGFVKATANGHALEYADGTPYFMVGDTWLAGSTWRLPFRDAATRSEYVPGPGIGFEDAVQYRKGQGFNSVSMIASFPNWEADLNPSTYADENGIYVRNAWEKFHYDVSEGRGTDASGGVSYWGTFTAKNMRDERGNLPFAMSEEHAGVSNFNRLNPEFFQSLDRKMHYLSEVGFVPLLETVRRDVGPSWNAYFDFNETFARYYQYLISRYGAYNLLFSGIHLDWVPEDFSLTAEQFNQALIYHRETYGPPPFGQLSTALIDRATHTTLGQGEQVPWLDMHSVGNKPRDHRVGENLEAQFAIEPPKPTINFEPYYTGWLHEINKPGGEEPPPNSARDVYFARAQMYGSVLSGGLSGHVHGTAAYDITTTGEPAGARPHIWEALQYNSAEYMALLEDFVLSEGKRYQELVPATDAMAPRKAPGAPEDGLDGWSYMMRTEDADFALLYFENEAVGATLSGFEPNARYRWRWYDPRSGQWLETRQLRSNEKGEISTPAFPEGATSAAGDWAAKVLAR